MSGRGWPVAGPAPKTADSTDSAVPTVAGAAGSTGGLSGFTGRTGGVPRTLGATMSPCVLFQKVLSPSFRLGRSKLSTDWTIASAEAKVSGLNFAALASVMVPSPLKLKSTSSFAPASLRPRVTSTASALSPYIVEAAARPNSSERMARSGVGAPISPTPYAWSTRRLLWYAVSAVTPEASWPSALDKTRSSPVSAL